MTETATGTASRLAGNRTLAYIAPFAAYMLLLHVKDVPGVHIAHPDRPWWQFAPEHWLYPLQTVVALGLVAFFWKQYTFRPLKGIGFGALIGVLGIMVWILPTWLHDAWRVDAWTQPQWAEKLPFVSEERPLWAMFGLAARTEGGFDPTLFANHPAAYWGTVLLRFIRMTIAVAFLEELFWRGFLWRYLVNMDRPFWQTPFGIPRWKPVAITIVLFMLVHAPEDYLGCLIYGILISWVAVRTRSLAACVVCHGVSNFILGVYIMATQKWGLW